MKKFISMILIALMLMTFCSCSNSDNEISGTSAAGEQSENENSKEQSGITDDVNKTPVSDPKDTGTGNSILKHSHVNETWDSGVVVDADVTEINRDKLPRYTGSLELFSYDKLVKDFGLNPEDAIENIKGETKLPIPGEHVYLNFGENKLIYNPSSFVYSGRLEEIGIEVLFRDGSLKNSDLFLTGKDLDFATIDEADKEIQKLLDKLGLEYVNDPVCYTMDVDTMSSEIDRIYEMNYGNIEDTDDEFFIEEKRIVTKEDEFYIFYYPVAVDGMPVSNQANGVDGDGSLVGGTEIKVCYGRKGIDTVDIYYQTDTTEKSEPEQIIPLEEIMKSVEEKYDSLILEGDYLINDIKLEYILQPINNKENMYNIVPVWRFMIEHEFDLSKGDGSDTVEHFKDSYSIIFDAITGEELPISIEI